MACRRCPQGRSRSTSSGAVRTTASDPPRFGSTTTDERGPMPATAPTVLATSIGFDSRARGPYDWAPGPVFDLAIELAGRPEQPRLCHLGTATGDDPARVAGVYGAFAGSAVRVSHLSLFPMPTVP